MRRLWQGFIGVLIVGAVAFTAATFTAVAQNGDNGDFGFRSAPAQDGQRTIVSVTPGSAAALAGLRPGDRFAFEQPFAGRVELTTPVIGDRLELRLTRPGGTHVELVAREGPSSSIGLLAIALLTRFAFLTVAALLALRAADQPAGRYLAMFLACFGAGESVDASLVPALALRVLCFFAQEGLFFAGVTAALGFAMHFPRAARRWQRGVLRALPAIFGAGLLLLSAQLTVVLVRGDNPLEHLLRLLYAAYFVALIVLLSVAFFVNFRAANGAERVRMRWVLTTFGFGFGGLVISLAVLAFTGEADSWTQYLTLTIVAMPFGLAYVILRHRMLDIGFVVNRALVYTGVSVVVVGTFIVFEWLLGHVIDEHSRASTVLQLAGALVLGLSVRFIHNSVDRYVDDLFFRERHEAERAVRRFAHEALLITDATELVDKTVDVAQRKMRLTACAFYTRYVGSYSPVASTFEGAPDVSENDYAVLQMRTWHAAVRSPRRRYRRSRASSCCRWSCAESSPASYFAVRKPATRPSPPTSAKRSNCSRAMPVSRWIRCVPEPSSKRSVCSPPTARCLPAYASGSKNSLGERNRRGAGDVLAKEYPHKEQPEKYRERTAFYP